MAHIKPSEMILPEHKLSKATEKMLLHFQLYVDLHLAANFAVNG